METYYSKKDLINAKNNETNYIYDLTDLEEFLEYVPTADVVPRGEVGKDIDVATKELAKKICCEIEEEICAALDSNYKALRTYDDGRNNDYILELVGRIKGKIDALRGIEAFVEELKEKYTSN